jgi:hypothetical protein
MFCIKLRYLCNIYVRYDIYDNIYAFETKQNVIYYLLIYISIILEFFAFIKPILTSIFFYSQIKLLNELII